MGSVAATIPEAVVTRVVVVTVVVVWIRCAWKAGKMIHGGAKCWLHLPWKEQSACASAADEKG